MKRFVSLVLTLSIVMSLFITVPVYAAEKETTTTKPVATDISKFTDVKGHWAETYLKWAVDNDIMVGVTTTKMSPNANITRAQMATMITRAFGATQEATVDMFIDVPKDAWYHSAVAKAVQMGFLETFGNSVNPNTAVTREEVAVSLVKAAGYVVGQSDAYVRNFSDLNQVTPNYVPYVSTAIQHGLIAGYTDGRLAPKDKITRAQFATILYRVANAFMNQTTTHTSKVVDGSLMVGIGNIELEGMSISKNLFLSDGVGTGEITLDNSTVGGVMYVRGTGPNTVDVTGRSRLNGVVFCNPNNAVHLVVDDNSSVGWVNVHEAKDSVTLEGDVGDVTVNTGKAPVMLVGATVDDLVLDGKLSAVKGDKATEIDRIILNESAAGAVLETNGRVGSLLIDAPDSEVNINGTLEVLEFGSSAEGTSFSASKDADMDEVILEADDLDIKLEGKMRDIEISSDDSIFEFGSATDSRRIDIDGNDVEFEFNGDVENIYTSGNDLVLSGKGDVSGKITITDGEDILITIPGATVYNKGGKDVYVGDILVRRGETVTVNASGTGTVEDDIENGRDPNAGAGDNNPNRPGGNKIYTLTLVANGGSCNVKTLKTDGSGVVSELPTPTRNGYEFLGWFTAVNGGNLIAQGVAIDRHTILYAQWREAEKPGGGEGEDPDDPNKPGGGEENPNAVTPTMLLGYPSNAQPSDFGYEGIYSLASFGDGITLDQSNNKLTGTVKYIEDFRWYENAGDQATGYYVPLMLMPSAMSASGVVMVGDRMFMSHEIISNGTGHPGQMIAYLYLNPTAPAAEKKLTITYDPDGSGKDYNAAEIVVDYSGVSFAGGDIDGLIYEGVRPLPGVDGAETATMDSTETDRLSYKYVLHTKALLETSNKGRYGYWTGLRIPAYVDSDSVMIKQVDPTGSQSSFSLSVETNEAGDRYVDLALNAENKVLGEGEWQGVYRFELTWASNTGGIGAHEVAKIVLDIKDCKLAGEATDPSVKPDAVDVASNLAINLMTPEETTEKFGIDIDDLGIDLRITQNTLGGTLVKYTDTDKQLEGFYLPIKITGTAKANVKLERDEGNTIADAITDADEYGNFTVYALFEMTPYGNTVADTRIEVVPETPDEKYKAVNIVLRCDASMLTEGGLIVSGEIPTGTVGGIEVSSMIEEPNYRVFYNTLEASGTVKKLTNVTISDTTWSEVWILPVTLRVFADDADYKIVTSMSDSGPFHTVTAADVVDRKVTVLVPVAIGQDAFAMSNIEMLKGDGTSVSSVGVYTTELDLDGYVPPEAVPDPDPEGGGEGGEVTPQPENPPLKGITVDASGAKLEYKVGDALDPKGIKVEATYETDEGPLKETVSEWTTDYDEKTFDTEGTVTITVSYTEGKNVVSDTFDVTVVAAKAP